MSEGIGCGPGGRGAFCVVALNDVMVFALGVGGWIDVRLSFRQVYFINFFIMPTPAVVQQTNAQP